LKKKDSIDTGMKKVSSAVVNMSALIDDVVKKARKNFSESGSADIDAKFLKESVSALRELFELLEEQNGVGVSDGISIKVEKTIEDWSK
jgi:outer membrane protein TolC